MATPQDILYSISQKIQDLSDLFESDENGDNIFDTIKQMELQMEDLINSHQRLEHLMNIIIKLLSNNE